ncbi:DNA repair protein [Vibrio vulnificus]|nr:DNA repair protein [Vibrio vulnificus]
MDNNADYKIKSISSDEIVSKLQGSSPLQACKVLLDVELHDQRDSLKVLEEIEKEMSSSNASIGESLIQPIILSICDGFVSHPKLKLSQKGLTASRLATEIQHFSYDKSSHIQVDERLDKVRLDEHSTKQVDDKGQYNTTVRDEIEDLGRMKDRKDSYQNRYMKDKIRVYSELEVNEQGERKHLRRKSSDYHRNRQEQDKSTSASEINVDHQVPLKNAFDEYGVSRALTKGDLKSALNHDDNLGIISAKLNTSKGEKSWTEYSSWVRDEKSRLNQKQKAGKQLSSEEKEWLKSAPSKKTLENALEAEKKAKSTIEKELNSAVVKNFTKDGKLAKELGTEALGQAKDELSQKGIGELIMLIIKPIFFEFSDSFKNGVLHGFDTKSKLKAIKLRFQRASSYIMENIASIGFDVLKDILKNFVKYLINAIVNMFVGLLKKALQIIVEGFSAIIQSIKILMSDSSPAQKADAITKLLATTVVTYVSFAIEEMIAPYVGMIPVVGEYLKDATGIMVSGIGSTIVVWLLEQADIFSNKAELRTKRVKEVFEMRIQQIKENTDAFEQAAIAKLAQDKLQFRKLTESLNDAIENNRDVNKEVENVAKFLNIELDMTSNDDFFALLENNHTLVIA